MFLFFFLIHRNFPEFLLSPNSVHRLTSKLSFELVLPRCGFQASFKRETKVKTVCEELTQSTNPGFTFLGDKKKKRSSQNSNSYHPLSFPDRHSTQKEEKGSSFIKTASPFNRVNFRFGKTHNPGFVVFILWRNQGWVTMVQV